jgi:hypothetical protein
MSEFMVAVLKQGWDWQDYMWCVHPNDRNRKLLPRSVAIEPYRTLEVNRLLRSSFTHMPIVTLAPREDCLC